MLDNIISLVSAGHWLGLAIFVLTLLQAWMQPNSKFPISVPERFQPLVAIVLGQAYAVLLVVGAGQAWSTAMIHGAIATGIVLLTSHAIWEADNAPAWVKALAFMLQTVDGHPSIPTDGSGSGGGTSSTSGGNKPSARSLRSKLSRTMLYVPRPLRTLLTGSFIGAVLSFAVVLQVASCSAAANGRAVHTAIDLDKASCIVLHADLGNQAVDDICALTEELLPFVPYLIAARNHKAANVGGASSASSAKVEACTIPPEYHLSAAAAAAAP